MNAPLDLSITLTPPPASTPPEAMAGISLWCNALGLNHTGDLLSDPLAQEERDSLLWYLEEYWKWPYLEFASRGRQVEMLLIEVGKRLYHAVFGSIEAQVLVQKWKQQPADLHQITIVTEIPSVLSLPWELLYDELGFLVLRPSHPISIVRRLPYSQIMSSSLSMPFGPPLRILLAIARPEGTGFIDPRGIAHELVDEMQAQVEAGTIEIEFLRPPTLAALRARLGDTSRPIHVFHFDGHGVFDEEVHKQGILAFESEVGNLSPVRASDLAKVLQGSNVRLAVLTACQSAMSASDDALSSVAAQLIWSGLEATIAMSGSVLVASATRYVEAFYRELAKGTPLPLAHELARGALHDDPYRHPHRRRRAEESKPVELQDWWLPHFYQQRPLALQPTMPKRKHIELQQLLPLRRLNDMPSEPRYGFSGRARELLQIERALMQGKLVVISGFGGVGKTALAREAADWLTRTKMFDGACFVSFEQGGDVAMLLSVLGDYSGVYDDVSTPHNHTAILAHLRTLLRTRRILLVADSIENAIPGRIAMLEIEARSELYDVLLELSKMGVGVLLTSRGSNFEDDRLVSGSQVARIALEGLNPEDAYILASSLLDTQGIDRSRVLYPELCDLLVQLDHHPLAISLVLPVLHTYPITKIRDDFAMLLPDFVDEKVTGRNKSLLASLNNSLQRLSEEQRALLHRLKFFENGANEIDLLAITEIPAGEWMQLRSALEHVGLLKIEIVHEAFIAPFLHFHPVLAPFLHTLLDADDTALRQRYIKHYYGRALYLLREDTHRPGPTRMLVRREFSNIQRVLRFLVDADELESATLMHASIGHFLQVFHLAREYEQLREWMAEAKARSITASTSLTRTQWQQERELGDDEFRRGNVSAASDRFAKLLTRIEAFQEGAALGPGSFEHGLTLARLAQCYHQMGQLVAAENRQNQALRVIDTLIKREPENQDFIEERGRLLNDLGMLLFYQGQYTRARAACIEGLKIAEQQGNLPSQAVSLNHLGMLAIQEKKYGEARSRYITLQRIGRALNDPRLEAAAWHHLGLVARERNEWAEAERCYRESLARCEMLDDKEGAARSCFALGMIAVEKDYPTEAESWYQYALKLAGEASKYAPLQATVLINLASLLLKEVRANRVPVTRLVEARKYAEQALTIDETLDPSSLSWETLRILAGIATLEGRPDAAKKYRIREYEIFATDANNRQQINHQHISLIYLIAAAAKGNIPAQTEVQRALPQLEKNGWHIATAVHRLWAGERDWHTLNEDLDRQEALLIRRVLETLLMSSEAVMAVLSPALREAVDSGDSDAYDQILSELSLPEQQVVAAALLYVQILDEEELALKIATIATKGIMHQNEMKAIQAQLQPPLRKIVQRIWAGEREAITLMKELDEQDTALVSRVLTIIALATNFQPDVGPGIIQK